MASLKKRNDTYQIQYYVNGKQKRLTLGKVSTQVAKAKLHQFELAQAQGTDNPLPTRTSVPDVLTAYVDHIRAVKSPKSAQNDIYYLREMFGPCCSALQITSRRASKKARKKPELTPEDGKASLPRIEATHFEAISVASVRGFIEAKIRRQGIAPKTANHYRSILRRLFNWATQQQGIRMPGQQNPAAQVESYREKARPIRYLTLKQIDEQLEALRFQPQLQTMAAVLIYAGLRRSELLWLTKGDIALRAGRHGLIRIQPKVFRGEHWGGKTAGSIRCIPISSQLRPYLDRYTVRPSIEEDAPGGGWYFPSPDGQQWDGDNFAADLRDANRNAGLSWSALDYRHTFGSHLAQNGVSLFKISQLMGNSPEICRRHYAALVPEAMVEEVEFGQAARQPLKLASGQ